jgi:alpha-D-xyloside xylohydrolase
MQAQLRGGLSLGLSGFSFWSHDIGGFVIKTPEDLYRRWLPFGMLTSHTRTHGAPPKEPWEYNESFNNAFREATNMRYRLMPYIYAQSKHCAENGLPMLRALFVEYPNDPGSWLIDNQYLLGSDILVAPMMENDTERDVYLPGGKWIDYQTKQVYNPGWHRIKTGKMPVVMLIRDGAVIPQIKLAQSTMEMDWSSLDLVNFSTLQKAEGFVCLPSDNKLQPISLTKKGNAFGLDNDPLAGKVKFKILNFTELK